MQNYLIPNVLNFPLDSPMKSPKKTPILVFSAVGGVLAIAALLGVVLPPVIKTNESRKSGGKESAVSSDVVIDLFDETGDHDDTDAYDKLRKMEKELKELREELQNERMKNWGVESGDQEDDAFQPDDDSDLEYFIEIPNNKKPQARAAEDDLNENDIPDEWKKEFGISADTAPDSDEDSDGFTLFQEYTAKTDPTDPLSHPTYISRISVSAISQRRFSGLELVSVEMTKADKKEWEAMFNVVRNNRKRSEFVRINIGTFKNNNVDFCLIDIDMDDKTQEPVAYIQRVGKQERIPCRIKLPVYDPVPRVRLINTLLDSPVTVDVGSEFKLGTVKTGEERYRVVSADPATKEVVVESVDGTYEQLVLLPEQPDSRLFDPPERSADVNPASDEDSDGFSLEQEQIAGTDPADPLSHPNYINEILVSNVILQRFPGLELVSVDRTKANKKDWIATFNVVRNNRKRSEFVRINVGTFRNNNVDFTLFDIEADDKSPELVAYIQRIGKQEYIPCRIKQPVCDPVPSVLLFNTLNGRTITTAVDADFRLGTAKTGQKLYHVVSADPATKQVVVEDVGTPGETISIPFKPMDQDPTSDEDSDGFTLAQESKAGTDPRDPLSHPRFINQIFVSAVSRQSFPDLELVYVDVTHSDKKDWTAVFNVVNGNSPRLVSVPLYSSRSSQAHGTFTNNNVDFRWIDIRIDENTQELIVYIQRVGREERIPCRIDQPIYDPVPRVSLVNAMNDRTLTLSVGSSFNLGTAGTGEEQYRVVSADPATKKVVVESLGWMTGTFSLKAAPRSVEN